jgi:hypothetical protein
MCYSYQGQADPSQISHRTTHSDQSETRSRLTREASDLPSMWDDKSKSSHLGVEAAVYAALRGLPRLARRMTPIKDEGTHRGTILTIILALLQHYSRT